MWMTTALARNLFREEEMALNFLNNCRSFDTERSSVSFWGHDNMFEVAFRLDQSTLRRLTGLEEVGEAAALAIFDAHTTHVRAAARRVYRKNAKRFNELTAADI
jgi:hypothetical protein